MPVGAVRVPFETVAVRVRGVNLTSVAGDAFSRRGRLASLALSLEEDDLPGLEGG